MKHRHAGFAPAAMILAAAIVGATLPAASALAQPASAAGGRGERMVEALQKRFAAADKNSDGKLSRDEAKAGMPRIAEHFDEIDTAHAGSITLQDIERWAVRQRAARKGTGS